MGISCSDLQLQAEHRATPQAHDTNPRGRGNRASPKHGAACLASDAQEWQTPPAGGGESVSRSGERIGEKLIAGQATTLAHSLQAPAPASSGPESLPSAPTSRPRLNPAFVEWLMGLPHGWTDFVPLGTEWFRYRRRMRSYLFGLVCRRIDQ